MSSSPISVESARIPSLPQAGYYIPNFITADEETKILSEVHRLPSSRWTILTHRRLLSLPSQLTGPSKNTLIAAPLPKYLDQPILSRLASLGVFADSPHNAPNHCLVNEYQPGEGIMPHTDGPAYYPITATVSLGSHTVLDIYQKRDDSGGDKDVNDNNATSRKEDEEEQNRESIEEVIHERNNTREHTSTWRILQEPRSLLITTQGMYTTTLHGIADVTYDTNLTRDSIANWDLLGDVSAYSSNNGNENVGGREKGGCKMRETRVSLTYRDVLKVAKLGGALKFMNK